MDTVQFFFLFSLASFASFSVQLVTEKVLAMGTEGSALACSF